MFSQIREIALWDGPLFKHDVIKLDHQDDNAAQRLFSASTIQWLTCTYFFLDFWETFLDQAHYPKAKYFLSKEVVDIIQISIRGFFEILFIHRDHLSQQWALFAYLTGTSLCEHVFRMARTFDPDFTLYSWYILKSKLTMMLEQAVQQSWQSPDSKARTCGYNHSYLDRHGVDVQTLSLFPTDNQIDDASQMGYDDAFDLFCLLGLSPNELKHERSSTLPSIRTWFTEEPTSIPLSSSTSGDHNIDTDSDSESETESEMVENIEPYTVKEEQDLMSQRFAAVALELDKKQHYLLKLKNRENDKADEEATELSSKSRSAIADLVSALSIPNHDDPSQHVERATAEKKLKASFQQIVNSKAAKDWGAISGLSRKGHYTKSAKDGREADKTEQGLEETSGNSANAAAVAS
ncbi:hypothetical protein F5050DRAFT_1715291 [Lentinula boryana]|uniref:Uncharacterized protein n=1 Tax=Lentinula boryana TaxID=40481 RepID=A0ABQ8Q1R5_9AGAR|nr:hypothetical protein F5050DRAFT_1715291 [Lentinula boryana]